MAKMFNVKNRSTSVVGYTIPDTGVRRSFAPGETKQISLDELEKLSYVAGGNALLTNFLQIERGANLMKNVEPEYYMSEEDVKNLITNGSLDEFLDALDFAPVGVIDLIKSLSVTVPLYDMQKRAALKQKTGFDVDAAIKHSMEDKEDEQETILKQGTERRVKKEEEIPPAGRRTTGSKYNVVTPKSN
jgi:hypothetical protein